MNTTSVASATYSAGYILGLTGQYNSLSFNGTALGNPPNNVAQGTDANFGPSVVSSNIASSLSGTNTVQYSVAMTGGSDNLVATVGLMAVTHPLSVNGVWSGTGGGSWNTAANWQGSSVPTSSGDTATFGAGIGSAAATITLDGNRTLSGLAFSTAGGGSYAISRSSGDTTSVLTLSNGTAVVSIANSGGNHTINVPVVLGSNLTVTATTGSELTVSGPISQGSPGKSVTFSGGGELILSGSDSYTGGTTVSGGTLDFAAPESISTSGILSIRSGGEVVLGALAGAAATATSDSEPTLADAAADNAGTTSGISGISALLARIRAAEATHGNVAGSLDDVAAAANPAVVPEPGTLALLLAATVALPPIIRRHVKNTPFRLPPSR